MNTDELKELADTLRYGSLADIWYDAHDYDEVETARRITEVQQAMIQAAKILDRLAEVCV